jgi:RNA polymerase-binding transcription factor DksA
MTQQQEENSLVPDAERHADDLDRASDLEMALTEDRIRETRRLIVQQQLPDEHGVYLQLDCGVCGLEIGAGRLQYAAKNLSCISCATLAERMARRRA